MTVSRNGEPTSVAGIIAHAEAERDRAQGWADHYQQMSFDPKITREDAAQKRTTAAVFSGQSSAWADLVIGLRNGTIR